MKFWLRRNRHFVHSCLFIAAGCLVSTVLLSSPVVYAGTNEETRGEMFALLKANKIKEVLVFYDGLPADQKNDFEIMYYLAQAYFYDGDYLKSARAYSTVLEYALKVKDEAAVIQDIRYKLADALDHLGGQHKYTKDLLLRIIFQIESLMQSNSEFSNSSKINNFLAEMLARLELVSIGDNVQSLTPGGDGQDFDLGADVVTDSEKEQALLKAKERIKNFKELNKAEPLAKSAPSDISLDTLIKIIEKKSKAIQKIHYKKMDVQKERSELIEEVFYQSPNKVRINTPSGEWVINRSLSTFFKDAGEFLKGNSFSVTHQSMMESLHFRDLRNDATIFNLAISKVVECPESIKKVCDLINPDLYLVVATIKPDEQSKITKKEYLIDTNTGISLVEVEYWRGIMGSGIDEELAKVTLVGTLQDLQGGVRIPLSGATVGKVQELSGLNQHWVIDVFSFNMDLDESNFLKQ